MQRITKPQLPLLAGNFYSQLVLPHVSAEFDIKRTSYKKFSAFVTSIAEQGVLTFENKDEGVMVITEMNKSAPLYRQHNALYPIEREHEAVKAKIEIRHSLCVPALLQPMFRRFDPSFE